MQSQHALGLVLSNFPIKEYRLIGQYYLGWCAYRKGQGTPAIFEKVVEQSATYRAKALWSLGAIESSKDNCEAELKYFTESMKYTRDFSTRIELARGIAVVKSKEGFRNRSLKDLESLIPMLRYAKPHAYYDFLNSYAVELCEVGRIEEARNISNIVLASPYINAYPEWRETREDIERKGYSSRSFVPVTQRIQTNIVRLPERENISVSQGEPARVLHFDWKSMVKEPNDTDDKLPQDATEKDIFLRIVQIATRDGITDKTLWKMLAAVEKIAQEQDKD